MSYFGGTGSWDWGTASALSVSISALPLGASVSAKPLARRDSTNCKCPFCGRRHYLGNHEYECKYCGGDVLAEGVL